ncbi:MAG TPA: 4Fe-4S dicluster domain-containing protein [Elusimicrobiota bacterium]|nr:4Fe-4S dicluster domain-containing protein [Elusimicrobiota bacterium]
MTTELPKVNIDEKLGYLTYKADHQTHITIEKPEVCSEQCREKPCASICPAQVYRWEEAQNKVIVSFENCIECGACRMLCPFFNIKCHWPRGGFGVQYRYG